MALSTASLDHLQRLAPPAPSTGGPATVADPASRRALHVKGYARERKEPAPPHPGTPWVPTTSALLTGLYGYRIPLAFSVVGDEHGMRVEVGVWSAEAGDPRRLDRRLAVLHSVLGGLYPSIDLDASVGSPAAWPMGGLALGVPTARPPTVDDPAAPWDRIVRAMEGTAWSVLVLAQPYPETHGAALRDAMVNEMRAVQDGAKAELAPSPLAELYVELLKRGLQSSAEGSALGAWRVGCYLQGDAVSYPRLASVWRSVFSGEDSVPEPVRVHDHLEAARWAAAWVLPDDIGARGPGHLRHPFEYQTVLTSKQLSAYAHLPQLETPGFSVDAQPRFDAVTRSAPARAVHLGRVVHAGKPTSQTFAVGVDGLARHALVCGVTGAGKSTTIFSMLEQLHEQGVPFLVIEPAKSEYRSLLSHPTIGPDLQIFTLGDETASPFRLNPFEVAPMARVSEHLDAVRSTMAGSFGMWNPLPQVLERSLHEVYADRGWDLVTGESRRGDGDHWRSAPTLAHLSAKVESVTASLGYDDRIRGDIQAALATRLGSLRAGGKGRMLDTARSIPIDALLTRPTVLELDGMGDDDDKAFVMGLLLLRLVQHRRAQGPGALRHVLVIEEAHRLLTASHGRASQEESDPKGKVVEMFSNLLSEIRSYGQGVIIADQVPVRLAPDVVKNTGLKIAHRTVANDDRESLAGAMAMTDEQSQALASLPPGRAAVYGDGDDAPVLVQMADLKSRLATAMPTTADLAERARGWVERAGLGDVLGQDEACRESCGDAAAECRRARELTGDVAVQRALARLLNSTVTDAGALARLWPDVVEVVRARRTAELDETALLRAVAGHGADWYAEQRGSRAGWSYEQTDELAAAARRALLAASGGDSTDALRALQEALARRSFDPYSGCSAICGATECAHRWAVADVVASGRFDTAWREADGADAGDGTRTRSWSLCQDVAYELVEWPDETVPDHAVDVVVRSARQASLCFGQQMLDKDDRKIQRTRRWVLGQLLEQAGLTAEEPS